MFKIMKIVVQIGALRQEHHNKERHKTTTTMNSVAKKTTDSCTISWKYTLFLFQTDKFLNHQCVCLTHTKKINEECDSIRSATKQDYGVKHEPFFLEAFSHHAKVVAKHIFSIVNESKAKWCGCNKVDVIQIKKHWVCMIKKKRRKKSKSWVRQVRFLLNTCLK